MTSAMASISKPSSCASTTGSARRTLLARFHSLGDVILATGIALRLVDAGEGIDVVTAERFLPVFEGLPLRDLWTPSRLGVSAGRFDRIVDLQANETSRRLLDSLGPCRRNRARSLARRWLVFWGRRSPLPRIPHAVQRYAEAAGVREAEARRLRPRVVVTERDREEAQRFPQAWDATQGTCVGLAEGGSRRMKRWPQGRYDALAEALASSGIRSLRFLEPDGVPWEAPGAVRASLRPLKALVERCAVLVTSDSGVMHLAVALGVPVAALFGSTVLDFGFGPLGERDRVLSRDLPCRPCAVHGARFCWQGHGRCLREISVEDVLQVTLGLVDGGHER